MTIRNYKPEDKERCLEIFNSNCPLYFDQSEYAMFENWLDHQTGNEVMYSSPTYSNSEYDAYDVIEIPESGIVGCGGFYIVKDLKEARLAWGMIHADFHKKGYGTALFNHRRELIQKNWPQHTITLGTSQHSYAFYKKMGMSVTQTIRAGYGPDLDRYDMQKHD